MRLLSSWTDGQPGELPPERWVRLQAESEAIAAAASESPRPWRAAALLLAVGYDESRFTVWVGRGGCQTVAPTDRRCDGGRARSYWQLWRAACPALHSLPSDVNGTLVAARCALGHLERGIRRCGTVKGSMSRYAVGHGCRWRDVERRLRRYDQAFASLLRSRPEAT
jgi:hypothetical protein